MAIASKFSGKDAYVQAALVGLGLYFAAALIILVAILIVSPSDIGFPLFLIVPGLIVFAALFFLRRWGLIVGALLALFGLFAFTSDAGLVLTSPEAFFDFLLTLFTVAGLGIVLVACVVGFVQYFRGPVGNVMAPSIGMALRVIAVAVGVAALVSGVLTVMNANEAVSAEDKQGALELIAEDTKWNVQTLDARAGNVRLLVKNDDPTLHTFTMKDSERNLDIDVRLGPWSEQIVEIGSLQSGVYGFICRVQGHEEDMTGAVNVR